MFSRVEMDSFSWRIANCLARKSNNIFNQIDGSSLKMIRGLQYIVKYARDIISN